VVHIEREFLDAGAKIALCRSGLEFQIPLEAAPVPMANVKPILDLGIVIEEFAVEIGYTFVE
jgi:hypothetical protein